MSPNMTILYVEDEVGFQELLIDYCSEEDLDVAIETADNGKEAVQVQQESSIDCIVSDYHMPELNGVEMFEQLRERGVSIPVIFYTSSRTIAEQIPAKEQTPPAAILHKSDSTFQEVFEEVCRAVLTEA